MSLHQEISRIKGERVSSGPLSVNPTVQNVKRSFGLIHGGHVASAVDLNKGKVSARLDGAVFAGGVEEWLELSSDEAAAAGPVELLGPGEVAKPVANVVGVAGVDEHGDALEQ